MLQQLLQHNKNIDMKHTFYTFFVAISIATLSHAKSIVIESPTLEIILEHIPQQSHKNNKKILILLDVDETLVTTGQKLGSGHWYDHTEKQLIERGYTPQEAANIALAIFCDVRRHTKVELTLQNVPYLVEKLKKLAVTCLALTSQPFLLADVVNNHFLQLGFSFAHHQFPQELYFQVNKRISGFKHGIIMCNLNNKGDTLSAFLDLINYHPTMIIFVDDKLHKVIEVQKLAEKMGIDFVGIRFSGMDEQVKEIDLDKAAQQLDSLYRTGVIT